MSNEQITQLVIDELVGDITPEDAALLQKVLRENPAAANLRDNVIKLLTEGDMKGVLEEEITVARALTILNNRKHKKRVRFLVGLGVAITFLLLIISGVIYNYLQQAAVSAYTIHLQASLYKYPVLIFEDGSAIRLDTITPGGTANLSTGKRHKTVFIKGPVNGFTKGTLFTARGESYGLVLPEGTTIDVDGNTSITLSWDPTASSREIAVSGQAFIDVAHDPLRPFLVSLPQGGKLRVLGTSFNVNTNDRGRMQVALKDGALMVENGTGRVKLNPDSAASWQRGSAISKTKFDQATVFSWRNGEYKCTNATLRDLAPVMERCYSFQVSVDVPPSQDTSHFINGLMVRGTSVQDFLQTAVIFPSHDKFQFSFDTDSVLHISLSPTR